MMELVCFSSGAPGPEGPPSGAPLPHVCIQIENYMKIIFIHVRIANTIFTKKNDDDHIAQRGGHTTANTCNYFNSYVKALRLMYNAFLRTVLLIQCRSTEACSLGLRRTYLILEIHVMVN